MLRKAIVRATLFIAIAVTALLLASDDSELRQADARVVEPQLAALSAP